jgi:hypothetical protein
MLTDCNVTPTLHEVVNGKHSCLSYTDNQILVKFYIRGLCITTADHFYFKIYRSVTKTVVYKILGFYSGDYEERRLLVCGAVWVL